MFHVIEFISIQAFTVAPSNWLIGLTKCLWPPVKAHSRLMDLVKGRVVPENNWQEHIIRSLGAFDTYNEALKRLRKAEKTSDLQSNKEMSCKRAKRHSLTGNRVSDNDESLLSQVPATSVPQITGSTASQALVSSSDPPNSTFPSQLSSYAPTNSTALSHPHSPSVPPNPTSPSHQHSPSSPTNSTALSHQHSSSVTPNSTSPSHQHSTSSPANFTALSDQHPPSVSPNPAKPPLLLLLPRMDALQSLFTPQTNCSQLSYNAQILKQPSTPHLQTANDTTNQIPTTQANKPVAQMSETTQGCSCSTLQLEYCKRIEKELEALKKTLETHTYLLQEILTNQTPDSVAGPLIHSLSIKFPFPLPLTNTDDLSVMDTYLADDANFARAVSYFGSFGGQNLKRSLRRILTEIISHELSLQLNWCGRREKHGFKQYSNIVGLIFRAVRSRLKEQITLEQTENFIKDWLRFSLDRNGGRCTRPK